MGKTFLTLMADYGAGGTLLELAQGVIGAGGEFTANAVVNDRPTLELIAPPLGIPLQAPVPVTDS